MTARLRVVLTDDERPARRFLASVLAGWDDVAVVGEAAGGPEAIAMIERERPDLALLDLQMPEVDGLGVVRLVRPDRLPLVAFVTAYDEYAVRAFEANAIDYLLKPVEPARLRRTINRALERLERADARAAEATDERARLGAAAADDEREAAGPPLRWIPVRRRDDIVLVPAAQLVSAVADGELVHLTTASGERHTLTYRLRDLEARLGGDEFVRLSGGTLVRVAAIQTVHPMPAGTFLVTLRDGQQHQVSRLRSRVLHERLFTL